MVGTITVYKVTHCRHSATELVLAIVSFHASACFQCQRSPVAGQVSCFLWKSSRIRIQKMIYEPVGE